MTYTFNFNSRETYLNYRAEWKERYKEASDLIRQIKRDLQEAHKPQNPPEKASALQSKLYFARQRANKLMLELEATKEFKNEQLRAAVAA